MKLKISKKQQKRIILISIFLLIFLLNCLIPITGDDFGYSFGLHGRLTSFYDILEKQYWHYFNWGGKNISTYNSTNILNVS